MDGILERDAQIARLEQLLAVAEDHARACDEARRQQQTTIEQLREQLALARTTITTTQNRLREIVVSLHLT